MLMFSFLGFCSLFLVFLLKGLSVCLAEKVLLLREELSPYECGFEHHTVSRIPFSLRYFFLTLIFLLFDLEIVLLIFLPYSLFSANFNVVCIILLLFIFILFFGLMYEWKDGTLDWLS